MQLFRHSLRRPHRAWLQKGSGYSRDGRQTFRWDGDRAEKLEEMEEDRMWELLRGDPVGASADLCSPAEATSRAAGGQRATRRAAEAMEATAGWSVASDNCHSALRFYTLAWFLQELTLFKKKKHVHHDDTSSWYEAAVTCAVHRMSLRHYCRQLLVMLHKVFSSETSAVLASQPTVWKVLMQNKLFTIICAVLLFICDASGSLQTLR